jgi:hypothetical protein
MHYVKFNGGNTMKTKFVTMFVIALALVLYGTGASATITNQLDATFQSGATFSGLVTFSNSFDSIVAVDGTLTGASSGPSPYAIDWVWFGIPISVGPGVNADFIGGDTFNGTSQNIIELDWNTTTRTLDNTYSFYGAPYLPNAINFTDQIVSYQMTRVPEPSTLLLVCGSLVGLAGLKRRMGK